MLIKGYVERVAEYPSKYTWPNGKPKPSMFAMIVDNVRYSTKNTKPPAVGEYIQFEAEQNGEYWNADPATITKAEPPTTASKAVPAQGTTFVNRDASIHYQSSRKDALEFLKLAASLDLIDFGKAKGAQKVEILEVFLDHYTERFVEDIKNLRPPEHGSPVDADPIPEAQAIARPARKPKTKPAQEVEDYDDDIPF